MRHPALETAYSVIPVGWVREGRGDPGQSDYWGQVVSTIEVDARFGDRCLSGLDGFSHVEIVFHFHLTSEQDDYLEPRRPRERADLPAVGIFAERGPRRPNRLGISKCEIVSAAGRLLRVRALDAVVGTPVLDIKPVMREFLPAHVEQPPWVGMLLSDYFRP